MTKQTGWRRLVTELKRFNRLSSKSYTGATPGVNYYYDGSTATKSIGRLIKASTTLQSDNTAAFTTYDSYDEFGRVTKSTQTVGTQPYVFHYTYNAAGGLETEQYPSTRTLTYCLRIPGQGERDSGVNAKTIPG